MLPIELLAAKWKWLFSFCLLIFSLRMVPAGAAQSQNGVTAPADGETLSGVVIITGTAVHPDYLRYELAFLNEANQAAGWIVFAEGMEPVLDGTLAVWDTTVGHNVGAPVFPDGRYRLRLRVVKTDYNYDEYFVTGLQISNAGPTPTPTPDETAVAATSPSPGSNSPPPTAVFALPTPLPSLTPFPTLTAPATAVGLPATPASAPEAADGGLIGQLEAVDTGRFGRAFWQGVEITLAIFGLMALYLFLRRLGRWAWRKFWAGRAS